MANNYSYFCDNNDDMDQLDKLAHEINEKKKKYNLIKSVHEDFYNESIKNKNQLNEALQNDNFLKPCDKTSDDNLSELLQHLKNEHNDNHSISELESISSNSNESIIKHLKKCNKCKSKIKLSFDKNHIKIKKNNNDDKLSEKKIILSFSELKEYLILILLGFLILLILYIFFKLK